jgi:hypothetical protein
LTATSKCDARKTSVESEEIVRERMAKVKGRIEPLTFNYYLLAMGKGTHPCLSVLSSYLAVDAKGLALARLWRG